MSFLEAIYLSGLLATAIPVVIHLLDRRKATRIPFPTLRFLEEIETRKARRMRLNELWLLLIRIAALALLATALARPVLREGALGRGRSSRVFLIDNSLSMSARAGEVSALERSRLAVRRLLGHLGRADRHAVVALHGRDGPAPALTESRAAVDRSLEEVGPTWRSGDLPGAIERALTLAGESTDPTRQVLVFSDLQASAFAGRSPGAELPDDVDLLFLTPVPAADFNAVASSVDIVAARPGEVEVRSRWRAHGRGDRLLRYRLWLDGALREERALRLSAGAEREIRTELGDLAEGVHRGRVEVRGDDLAEDDARSFAFVARGPLRVLVARDGARAGGPTDPAYFLLRALASARAAGAGPGVAVAATEELGGRSLGAYDVVFLVEPRRVDEATARQIAAFVGSGGGLLVATGPAQEPGGLEVLRAGREPLIDSLGAAPRRMSTPCHLSQWVEDHPVWAPLLAATPPLRPDVPYVTGYRPVETGPGARVLARFSTGDPALVERRVGGGRVLVWATTLSREWTNLPLRFVYAPLVDALATYLGGTTWSPEEHRIGEPVALSYPGASRPSRVRVLGPEGERTATAGAEEELEAGIEAGIEARETPGLFLVLEEWPDRTRHRVVAIRPDPAESDLSPLADEEVERLYPGATRVAFRDEGAALRAATAATTGFELQNPLLLLLLGLLLLEPLLANRIAARRRDRETGSGERR